MDISETAIFWTIGGLAALVVLAAVVLAISLRRRSDSMPSEHPRIEPTTRPSWAQPAPDEEPPEIPTRYGAWAPTVGCNDQREFAVQLLEATGNYSIQGRDADVDCELTFLLRAANAVGDTYVGGMPFAADSDVEVYDASLEELDAASRDDIPLRAVIFRNDTRVYLGIAGQEFRSGPTYRLRFRASFEAAAD